MVTEAQVQDAIGLFHGAGLDPAACAAALEHIAATLDTGIAAVALLGSSAGITYDVNVRADPQATASYAQHYGLHDPVLAALRARPAGEVIPDQVACSKAELWRSRFHDEWCRPHDFEHSIQASAFCDASGTALFAAARSRRRGVRRP